MKCRNLSQCKRIRHHDADASGGERPYTVIRLPSCCVVGVTRTAVIDTPVSMRWRMAVNACWDRIGACNGSSPSAAPVYEAGWQLEWGSESGASAAGLGTCGTPGGHVGIPAL